MFGRIRRNAQSQLAGRKNVDSIFFGAEMKVMKFSLEMEDLVENIDTNTERIRYKIHRILASYFFFYSFYRFVIPEINDPNYETDEKDLEAFMIGAKRGMVEKNFFLYWEELVELIISEVDNPNSSISYTIFLGEESDPLKGRWFIGKLPELDFSSSTSKEIGQLLRNTTDAFYSLAQNYRH